MARNVIVGTGFSGMLAYLLLDRSDSQIIGVDQGPEFQRHNQGFLLNKFFGLKAYSDTRLANKLVNIKIHDRLIHGGNGTIWGGFFNTSRVQEKNIKWLEGHGISLVPLSYFKTGSKSKNKKIYQLQNIHGNTMNPIELIRDFKSAYLEKIRILGDGSIELLVRNSSRTLESSLEILKCERLILAVGVVQFIDLLYRSDLISDGDVLELSEFEYHLRMGFKFTQNNSKCEIIRVNILRGLLHYLGVQWYPRLLSIIDMFIPFVFEQVFSHERLTCSFMLEKGALVGKTVENQRKFGTSIHYCNLKINSTSANDYLKSISSNIIGLGMAFVQQNIPGPISNDIMTDTINKITHEK